MRLSSILLGLLPAVGVLADPFAAANHKTCKNGPVSLYGRQCQRYCGYEFTSGSYKNDYQSCFNDCAAACAKDQQCNSAKWSTSSKKCYYNKNKSPYWQKTGRGHAVKCDKKPKPKTTTTKRTTTISTTKSTSLSTAKSTTASTTPSTTRSTTPSTTFTSTTTASACSPSGISPENSMRVQQSFTQAGVVPTLIPSIQPKVAVAVVYGSKSVDLGNEFTIPETVTQPSLRFSSETDQDPVTTKYTYVLVDSDVPNPDSALRMTFLHWMVSDAQPFCIADQSPQTIAAYQALTPASVQQHRYTFLVYRQPPGYAADAVTPQIRTGFDINAYASAGGLVLVGGNFLRVGALNGAPTP